METGNSTYNTAGSKTFVLQKFPISIPFLRSLALLLILALLFVAGNSCSKPFPEGELFNQWIIFRLIPLPQPTVTLTADSDRHYSEFQGTLTITPPADESWIDTYKIYWGKNGANVDLYTEVPVTGSTITVSIPANTVMPDADTDSIRVYAKSNLGNSSAGAATATVTDLRQHYIFVSNTTNNGNLRSNTYGTFTNGIVGADEICQGDHDNNLISWNDATKKSEAKSFEAVLVDGNYRQACEAGDGDCKTNGSANKNNWVLYKNTQYFSATSGDSLFTSNENAIFIFTGGKSFSVPIGGTGDYWTGLKADWTPSTDNCHEWISVDGISYNGQSGSPTATNFNVIYDDLFGGYPCDSSRYILCAEQ